MIEEQSNTNQRVTNAVIQNEIGHLIKKLDKANDNWEKLAEDSAEVKTCMAVLKSNVDDLKKKTQIWDLGNSALGLILASVMAYFGTRN